MRECSRVAGGGCVPFFIFTASFCNLVMFNLFITLVLEYFSVRANFDAIEDPVFDDDRNEVKVIVDRFRKLRRCCLGGGGKIQVVMLVHKNRAKPADVQ